jgi:polyhydroxyalkanoate synthesis regulator phasin
MIEIIKKVIFAGIGAFALTEEKAKEIINELVKQGEITTGDAEKLIKDIKQKFTEAGKSTEDKFLTKLKEYLHITELEKRIAKLEKEIEIIKTEGYKNY